MVGVLLLFRRLKSQGYNGSEPTGANVQGSVKDTVPQSPMVSNAPRQENEASYESSTTISNPREESRVPIGPPQSIILALHIENRTPLGIYSATTGAPQRDHEEDKKPQELPPNQAPLPEIASSDAPQSRHELPSPDPAVQEHSHPRALQPGRPDFRPYSPTNLSQAPQPYGLAFRPHSPSRLSMVSSVGGSPALAHDVSPISVAKDGDINANV